MTCRLCGSPTRPLVARPDVALHTCSACGFVSGFPARPESAELRYAGYHRGDEPPAPKVRYREWLSRAEATVGGPGRMLEVGAGRGAFVRVAQARGWEAWASEVSASGLEDLHRTSAHVVPGDLVAAGLPGEFFRLVVCLEVIEHVPEPMGLLRELQRVTAPGGQLLLTTPNFGGLSRRWLGARWRVIDPEHLGYFTPRTLRTALERAGFVGPWVASRGLDVTTWRASRREEGPARFDPAASAALRDRVEGSPFWRTARACLNAVLRASRLGDSLLAWATK